VAIRGGSMIAQGVVMLVALTIFALAGGCGGESVDFAAAFASSLPPAD